jgi:hypothetical protein
MTLVLAGWRWDEFGVELLRARRHGRKGYGPVLGACWGDFDRSGYSNAERDMFVEMLVKRTKAAFGEVLPEDVWRGDKKAFTDFLRQFEADWERTLSHYRNNRTVADKVAGWFFG